jgi:hypothetical protein
MIPFLFLSPLDFFLWYVLALFLSHAVAGWIAILAGSMISHVGVEMIVPVAIFTAIAPRVPSTFCSVRARRSSFIFALLAHSTSGAADVIRKSQNVFNPSTDVIISSGARVVSIDGDSPSTTTIWFLAYS